MIREIVMSDTYRRSATYSEANYAVDPDNKFLWRANPRQIDAESLRDAMLAMSGRLNPERPKAFAAAGTKRDSLNSRDSDTHRSVYVPIIRDQVPDSLDLFGFPDPNITSPGRPESIVPTQALYLMNGDFVTAQAQGMASTIEQRFDDTSDQMRMAILWAYGRPATSDELQASAQFFREFQRTGPRPVAANNATSNGARRRNGPRGQGKRPRRGGARGAGGPPVGNQTPLSVFCQTLMASSSFRILD